MIKIFIKRKGFLICILFCIVKCIAVYGSGYDSNYFINQDTLGYSDYMEQYSGKVTKKVQKEILNEYDNIKRVKSKIAHIYGLMRSNKITKNEYMEQTKEYLQGQEKSFIFQVIYSKYTYSMKDVEKHYLLDSRGWETLLTHNTLDYILVFAILILITPIFTYEYDSKMEHILNSSKYGKMKTVKWKLEIAILSSILLTCIFQLISFLYLKGSVGLAHGNYPVQSIPFYEKFNYDMTIAEVYLLTFLFKILGSALMALTVCFFAIVGKRGIITLVAGSASVLLPALIDPTGSLRYYLPLPTGLMTGNGFLWPSQYEIIEKHERCYQFYGMSKGMATILVLVLLLEAVILFFACIQIFSKRSFSLRIKKAIFLVPFFVFFLVGCKHSGETDKYVFLEEQNRFEGEYNEKKITLLDNDITQLSQLIS